MLGQQFRTGRHHHIPFLHQPTHQLFSVPAFQLTSSSAGSQAAFVLQKTNRLTLLHANQALHFQFIPSPFFSTRIYSQHTQHHLASGTLNLIISLYSLPLTIFLSPSLYIYHSPVTAPSKHCYLNSMEK